MRIAAPGRDWRYAASAPTPTAMPSIGRRRSAETATVQVARGFMVVEDEQDSEENGEGSWALTARRVTRQALTGHARGWPRLGKQQVAGGDTRLDESGELLPLSPSSPSPSPPLSLSSFSSVTACSSHTLLHAKHDGYPCSFRPRPQETQLQGAPARCRPTTPTASTRADAPRTCARWWWKETATAHAAESAKDLDECDCR